MNKVANTYWTNPRLAAQTTTRTGATALNMNNLNMTNTHSFVPARPATAIGARSAARAGNRNIRLVSPFAVFSMVIITMCALCFTVTRRTHAEMQTAETQYATIHAEVEDLRNTNSDLKQQVQRLSTDPRAIEAAARERLGMVRPNDIIVPVR